VFRASNHRFLALGNTVILDSPCSWDRRAPDLQAQGPQLQSCGPCLCGPCEIRGPHKRRRHPERCRLASFPGTRSNPCPSDLGARSRAASARESAGGI